MAQLSDFRAQKKIVVVDHDPQKESITLAAKSGKKLQDILIEKGLISHDQIRVIEIEATKTNKTFDRLVVELGFLSEQTWIDLVAEIKGQKTFDLRSLDHSFVDWETLHLIPQELARKHCCFLLHIDDKKAELVISDCDDVVALDAVKNALKRDVEIATIMAARSDILRCIDQLYGLQNSIESLIRDIEELKTTQEDDLVLSFEKFENPTVRLINAIIVEAIKSHASDIHFEPDKHFVRMRYRIDGHLENRLTFHKSYWSAICVRLKVMSALNIAESRKPQNGRFVYHIGLKEIDFRIATHPTIFGENIVIRILDKERVHLDLQRLGYTLEQQNILEKLILRPEGLFVITGPTGSGKTTSLYAFLSHINQTDINIMTLEEPVEYQLPLVRQSEVGDGCSIDFADGIKSILRQDPDVILVGEVRDENAAQMALRAAMTGHRVLTTLHTNDSIGAIYRLMDLGMSRDLLAGNIIGIIAQRLVRTLCSSCKKESEIDEFEKQIFKAAKKSFSKAKIYKPDGCEKCRFTGFFGRTAVVEILKVDRTMDDLIATSATRSVIFNHVLSNGFKTLALEGIEKVLSGVTSMDEVRRVIDISEYVL